MRIAFCFSAHMRKYKNYFNDYIDNVYYPLSKLGEIDVFIHTWDTLGPKHSWHTFSTGTEGLDLIKTDPIEIASFYNPKTLFIENYEKTKPILYLKNYTHKKPGTPALYQEGICSTTVSYYKIWACNELKKDAERREGFKYDIVVRLRPDMRYTKFRIDRMDFKNVYVQYHRDGVTFDQFAIGGSAAMDVYSNCFARIGRIYQDDFDFGGERTLWRHIALGGVDIGEMEDLIASK